MFIKWYSQILYHFLVFKRVAISSMFLYAIEHQTAGILRFFKYIYLDFQLHCWLRPYWFTVFPQMTAIKPGHNTKATTWRHWRVNRSSHILVRTPHSEEGKNLAWVPFFCCFYSGVKLTSGVTGRKTITQRFRPLENQRTELRSAQKGKNPRGHP